MSVTTLPAPHHEPDGLADRFALPAYRCLVVYDEIDPELPVILMTAWASLERAVSLGIRLGRECGKGFYT